MGSILLAFFIDASWDSRVERGRTAELLDALEDEWTGEIDRIDEALGRYEASLAALTTIAAAGQESERSIPGDSAEVLISTVLWGTRSYKPSLAAVNSLLLTDLSGVDDPDLRAAIAAWPGTLEEPAPEQVRLSEMGFELVELLSGLAGSRSSQRVRDPESTWSVLLELWDLYGADVGEAALNSSNIRHHLMDLHFVQFLYRRELAEVRAVLAANLAMLRDR